VGSTLEERDLRARRSKFQEISETQGILLIVDWSALVRTFKLRPMIQPFVLMNQWDEYEIVKLGPRANLRLCYAPPVQADV
jgi:hypothetical protein